MVRKDINDLLSDESLKERFRVVVFGSARTKKGDGVYDEVFKLGKAIADAGFDIVTGGGPGSMEAANLGHESSTNEKTVHSYGINITLPFEQSVNEGVEIAHEHVRFSTRLDEFMSLANIVVITQGGIGTCLELFYTWQLIQVKQICNIPIVVVGDMWDGLFEWLESSVLTKGMFSEEDLSVINYAKDCDEAMDIIENWYEIYGALGKDACLNSNVYKLDKNKFKVLFDKSEVK